MTPLRTVPLTSIAVAIAASLVLGIGAAEPTGARPVLADKVLVEKSARRLTLFRAGQQLHIYHVALGKHPVGPKERAGDGRTPEGSYIIDRRILASGFHRALHISYPNASDVARAASLGVPPGGDIMIHGIKNGLGWLGPLHRASDWTQGCVAVTNGEIEDIWSMVNDGTAVEIVP